MILSFHPVLTLNTRHQAKMFQVVCHHRQSIMEGSGTNKYIKLPHLAIKVFSDVKNVFLHQSSRLISRINSFLRPSLIASSIRAASSGSSAQQPASDRSSRFRSSSVNSVFSALPLYTTELLSMAISSILTVSLRFFSISEYLILIGDCGVNAFPFITVSFRKPLQIYDKSAKQTKQ